MARYKEGYCYHPDMKYCPACKKMCMKEEFPKSKRRYDGMGSNCKSCIRAASVDYYIRNPGSYKKRHPDLVKKQTAKYRASLDGRAKHLYKGAKERAIKYNLEFDLCVPRIWVALRLGVCEATGVAFDMHPHEKYYNNPYSPSVDRKDPFKGYTYENVQVVCTAYNIGKGQMTNEEYISFCEIVAKKARR